MNDVGSYMREMFGSEWEAELVLGCELICSSNSRNLLEEGCAHFVTVKPPPQEYRAYTWRAGLVSKTFFFCMMVCLATFFANC